MEEICRKAEGLCSYIRLLHIMQVGSQEVSSRIAGDQRSLVTRSKRTIKRYQDPPTLESAVVLCKLNSTLEDTTYVRTTLHFEDGSSRIGVDCREVYLCCTECKCIIVPFSYLYRQCPPKSSCWSWSCGGCQGSSVTQTIRRSIRAKEQSALPTRQDKEL